MFQEKFYSKSSETLLLFPEYLNDTVIGMYQNKIALAQAQPQLDSYNSVKNGIAYYFHWDGNNPTNTPRVIQLKRRGNGCFHIVLTWNVGCVFVEKLRENRLFTVDEKGRVKTLTTDQLKFVQKFPLNKQKGKYSFAFVVLAVCMAS